MSCLKQLNHYKLLDLYYSLYIIMINIWQFSNFQLNAYSKNYFKLGKNNQIDQLQDIIKKNNNIIVMWGGTNILFKQKEYKNKFFLHIRNKGYKKIDKNTYEISAGHWITNFIKDLIKNDIHTLDPLYGLPGSIWWAIIGNAGSFGLEIWPFVQSVTYIDPNWKLHTSKDYKHSYRNSNYKNSNRIAVKFKLHIPDQKLKDQKNRERYRNRRKENQNFKNTCGCFWKNPKIDKTKKQNQNIIKKLKKYENNPLTRKINQNKQTITIATGWLTETLWLKWLEKYWVQISNKHWNFVLNPKTKNGKDILKFAKWVEWKIFDEFRIKLEKEVQIY